MPHAPQKLAKASLQAIKWVGKASKKLDHVVEVQFNPETLSLSYSTQQSGGDQRGGAALQFAGVATSKLTMDLWFDVTVLEDTQPQHDDVRRLTDKVVYFITPAKELKDPKNPQPVPPGVKVIWGKFIYEGIMDSLSQKLDYFSEDGRPLRAVLAIGITGMLVKLESENAPATTAPDKSPGTNPLQAARQNESIQQMAGKVDPGSDWKALAAANNIENPRFLTPGTLINPNIRSSMEEYKKLIAGDL
jgi:hypothetical protein